MKRGVKGGDHGRGRKGRDGGREREEGGKGG